MGIEEYVQFCINKGASDLHLTVGIPPMVRINGHLLPIHETKLKQADTEEFVNYFLTPEQKKVLDEIGELDTSVTATGLYRFRLNTYHQRGSYALAMRLVNEKIKSAEELGLPSAMNVFAQKSRGLVLVTGPTGSGKSTTLAALIDKINNERDCHILPLKTLSSTFTSTKSPWLTSARWETTQRVIRTRSAPPSARTPTLSLSARCATLILISIALTAAETGHLVFSTLHTIGAAKTIDRIVDVFPPSQQQQIRIQLSMTLQGVVSQQLLPRADNQGVLLPPRS